MQDNGYRRRGRTAVGVFGVPAILVVLVVLLGGALVSRIERQLPAVANANSTPNSPAMSGISTPGAAGAGAGATSVSAGTQVTPVDARSLIPRLQKLYTLPENHRFGIWGEWSPDGRLLLTRSDNLVQVWDAATGALKYSVSIENWNDTWEYSIEWSPDGRMLAVGSADGVAQLFSASDGAKLSTLSPPQPEKGSTSDIPFYPGIYSASRKMGCSCPPVPALSMAWSADGRFLASAQQIPIPMHDLPFIFRSVANVWDVETGAIVHRFEVSDDEMKRINANIYEFADIKEGVITPILEVAWSADGKMLAALFGNRMVVVWDTASEARLQLLNPDIHSMDFALLHIQWSPDDRTILEAPSEFGSDPLLLWDVATGHLRTFPSPRPPQAISWSAMPTVDPQIALGLPSPTPWPTYVHDDEQYQSIGAFAMSPDGNRIAIQDGNHLRLWDVASGKQTYKLTLDNSQEWGGFAMSALAWSPDGHALAYTNRGIKLMDPETSSEIRALTLDDATSIAWSPDGSMLAVLASDGLEVWGDSARNGAKTTSP